MRSLTIWGTSPHAETTYTVSDANLRIYFETAKKNAKKVKIYTILAYYTE